MGEGMKFILSQTLMVILTAFSTLVQAQQMWINELHYDNASDDVNEFVEVALHDIYSHVLSDIQVVYYNGSTGDMYDESNVKSIDTFVQGESQGSYSVYSKLTPGIQNGAPDGMALVYGDRVIQFISYEGSFTANNGPAMGLTSIDILQLEDNNGDPSFSLQLMGTGTQASDFSWQFPMSATMGMINTNQTLGLSIPIVEIFEAQGTTDRPAFDDEEAIFLDNIVTAIDDNGFFMQTPNIRDDNNVDTSNGIYVSDMTSVSIGDSVNVTGSIDEFFGLTRLAGVTDVTINSPSNELPDSIIFDQNVPSPDPSNPSCALEYECYESMLVEISNGLTNSGSKYANFDVINKVPVTANGLRARRETGINLSDTDEVGLPKGLPIFDENPEVFDMDPDGLGLANNSIRGGSAFSATGIMTYKFGSYQFLPKQLTLTNRDFSPIPVPSDREISIASQNLYFLFDDVDDPLISNSFENETTTEQFNTRLERLSNYFRLSMHSPEIIVVQEIENLNALQSLADKINADDPQLIYSAYHFANERSSGLNLGVLTRQSVTNVTVTELGSEEIMLFGNTQENLYFRVPQLINATVTKAGISQELNILSVHLKSRSNIASQNQGQANLTRYRRYEQSLSVAQMVQDLQTKSANIPLMVIGGFNAYEFTDGYVDVVGEIKGEITPEDNVLSSNGNTVVNPVLTNASDTIIENEKYSNANFNSTELLNHVLLNDLALMHMNSIHYLRGNADEAVVNHREFTGEYGLSDSDGFLLYFDILDPGDLIFREGFEQ